MGQSQSFHFLTHELLDEYSSLTYLSKPEIARLYKIFLQFQNEDTALYLNIEQIEDAFPQLKFNPFKDRIYYVFSSLKDRNFLSFEDVLDLCSVMSEKCPDTVKASWAFKVFDFDGDNKVGEEDLKEVIDRLTNSYNNAHQCVPDNEKERIINVLLQEINLEKNGAISQMEFEHAVGKMSEFPHSFCFKF